MTETITRNGRLAELAALTHEFLAPYAGLPDVAKIAVSEIAVDWAAEIELQLRSVPGCEVRDTAIWARELGTMVRFRDGSTYIEVSARTETYGHSVKIWDHIAHRDAYRLFARLDVDLVDGGTVDVDPARLLAHLSTKDGER